MIIIAQLLKMYFHQGDCKCAGLISFRYSDSHNFFSASFIHTIPKITVHNGTLINLAFRMIGQWQYGSILSWNIMGALLTILSSGIFTGGNSSEDRCCVRV